MYRQIDMIDSQINFYPDGSVEILGQSGHIKLKAEYAKTIKDAYEQFLKAYPGTESLKITINIEVPQPMGAIVNEKPEAQAREVAAKVKLTPTHRGKN